MITPRKVFDIVENCNGDAFQVVQKYETIDVMYSLQYIELTDEDIKALKDGKYLYSEDGEYATLISYK